MDNNSPLPTISIKPKDSTIDSKFGVVVTTPNYLQFFSDVPSYYQFLKDPKNYKDLLLGTVNIGNLIRNSLSNPEFKQFVQDIVLDIEIPPSIDIDTIVTIEGEQEVKGRKDFTGGLAVNGQNLIYDPVKKVWQLTGDLVVTGAVTMFGSLSGFTPSTVMDAVLVDGVTIVKDEQGRLTVIGGGGGTEGGLTSDEVNILIANALSPINKSLSTKWTQDDTKIANWDMAFKWGDHSKAGYMKSTDFNTQLKHYILKDTVEQISARHNFTDGLQIDGINIYKSQDKTIYLDANLVVSGAFAMFGNNSTTFETIWKDIPFDLNTMEWTGSEWRVIGGANNIDVTTVNSLIYEYLNRTGEEYAKQSWVNQQGFAKQSALTAVDNRLTAVEVFFATEDSDTLVNKWAEIVEFLNATEGDTLDNILKTKANQSALDAAVTSLTTEIGKKWTQDNSKIANWDSAYSWGNHANAGYAAKTYVDGELAKYILKDTAQTISARHNFSDGLKIGGLEITKSQDDVIYVDANLVVRGAVTMFGSGATIAPSIWASIPFDDTMEWNGSEWSVVGGGSGSVNEATVNNLIYEYLTKNSYAKISDISSALTGYATQTWVGNNYLSLSGGVISFNTNSNLTIKSTSGVWSGIKFETLTGGSGYIGVHLNNPVFVPSDLSEIKWILHSGNYTDYFTKANIKSTLGVSDWALAATKPSYTAAEVGALSINGGTISGNLSLIETNSIILRPSLYTHYSGIGYDTQGDECIAIWARNAATRLRWHAGINLKDGVTIGSMMGITPDFEVSKASGVAVGYIGGNTIIHSNNIGSQSVKALNTQTSIEDTRSAFYVYRGATEADGGDGYIMDFNWDSGNYKSQIYVDVDPTHKIALRHRGNNSVWTVWRQFAFTDSNVASATKLATARTVWGQNFDGTGNISGLLTDVDGIRGSMTDGGYIGDRNKGLGVTDGGSMIYNYSSSPITFHIAGFEHMRITNGGNVAIGGTTADVKLHVYGNIRADGELYINNKTILHLDDSNTWVNYGGANDGLDLRLCGRELIFQYGRGDAFTRAMTITSGGNVAIGGAFTPLAKFHVAGTGLVTDHFSVGANLAHANIDRAELSIVSHGDSPTDLMFGYSGTRKWSISSRSATSTVAKSIGLFNYEANAWAWVVDVNNNVAIGRTSASVKLHVGGDIIADGAVTMFSQLSMKNVIDYDGLSLAQLAQIKPARFTWKDRRDNRIHVGCIADYIQPILPEVVYETVNNELTVDYGSAAFYIGASLIKPVVELWEVKDKQQQEIESLKKRVEYLENENRQLRAS